MKNLGRKIMVIMVAAFFVGILLYLARSLGRHLGGENNTSNGRPKVLMVTTTEACHCALERCSEVREYLYGVLEEPGHGVVLEVIDYAKEPDSAERIMERFDVYTIPIVLVIDKNGQTVYKSEWDLDEGLLRTELKYLAE